MKRFFSLLLALLLALSLPACTVEEAPESESTTPDSESTSAPEAESTSDESTGLPNYLIPIDVSWHFGCIGSPANSAGYAYQIHENAEDYSYTDVIELGRKGTRVSFIAPRGISAKSSEYLVLSSWEKDGDEWVIDFGRPNIAGASELIVENTKEGVKYTYISARDNECIRFCYRSGQKSADEPFTFPVIYKESTQEPGTAEDILKVVEWADNDKSRAYYDVLEGVTMSVIGDSYFHGSTLGKDYVWPALLSAKYHMNFNNYGIGGSTISNYVTEHNPMVDRFTAIKKNNPDIILVEGGRNDFGRSVPMGELGSMDTKTMMGATRYLLTKLKERFPNAVIIGITCWHTGTRQNEVGLVCDAYGEAMMAVCADMGIPCINAMDVKTMGVDMTSASFRSQYCLEPNDVSHLNFAGMKLVMPPFEKQIAEIYAAALAEKNGQNNQS